MPSKLLGGPRLRRADARQRALVRLHLKETAMRAWRTTACFPASLFACVASGYAQEAMTIRGRVTDENKEPLATANVYIDGTGLATLTDTEGAYSLVIPVSWIDQEQHLLVADLIGYQSVQASVTLLGEDVTQDFQLPLEPIPLETIVGVAEAEEIRVSSHKPWTKTGIRLNKGEEVVVTATGRVNACQPAHPFCGPWARWIGPKGSTDLPILTDNGFPSMALVGRIGELSPFYIGSAVTFEALVDGVLYLGVNDQPNTFGDNAGGFKVTVRRRREPSGMAESPPGEPAVHQRGLAAVSADVDLQITSFELSCEAKSWWCSLRATVSNDGSGSADGFDGKCICIRWYNPRRFSAFFGLEGDGYLAGKSSATYTARFERRDFTTLHCMIDSNEVIPETNEWNNWIASLIVPGIGS